MWRRLTTPQLGVDIAIAAIFFVMFGVLFLRFGAWDFVVLLGLTTALLLRRLAPGLALGVAWVAAIVQMAMQIDPNPADISLFAIVYAAAAYGTSAVRWLALASSLVAPAAITGYIIVTQGISELAMCIQFQYAYCVTYVPDLAGRAVGWFIAFAFAFLLAWTIGQLVRTRIRARVTRAAMLAAEQEVAAEQERTRIARDMHDVVAHSLAVVVAQADGARYAARTDPAAAEEALRTIAATAREALGDVRVLLAQLRYQQEDGPQPTLVDLDHLVEQLRSSGLRIAREDSGEPLPLGSSQQIAVYRIVQESLTNVLRHADVDREVLLRFSWTSHGLELAVVSHLPEVKPRTGMIPIGAPVAGHGIAGMTERAALGGGWLRAGADGDRFVVTAWLPYQPTAPHAPLAPLTEETIR
ncbi:sensor histidine kinase [Protaetiibacter mangrovi]|uniref:histidine kinase n=1 Tax=Protaetiibacter mangrovi TaxID=2970926 RepID=A0ABT1ZEX2_9MICO|nr:histidine kinase [Protaetiibacter mangrovi]MCS0499261.1 histidine kinase [Protaetiibacter mangrovi]TPW92658.1 sensor histidine kinase [Schumannella luteola]